jgi:hypothetical protein
MDFYLANDQGGLVVGKKYISVDEFDLVCVYNRCAEGNIPNVREVIFA